VERTTLKGKTDLHFEAPVVGIFGEAFAVEAAGGLIGSSE